MVEVGVGNHSPVFVQGQNGTVTAGTVQGTFNSSSAAFEDITLADIFVTITDGAVSIVVP